MAAASRPTLRWSSAAVAVAAGAGRSWWPPSRRRPRRDRAWARRWRALASPLPTPARRASCARTSPRTGRRRRARPAGRVLQREHPDRPSASGRRRAPARRAAPTRARRRWRSPGRAPRRGRVRRARRATGLGAMRANRCSDWAATSGPRRSAPSVVTKRVVSPARSALWTTLAAAVTARSNASSPAAPPARAGRAGRGSAQALDAVLADLERSPSGPRPASGSCAARRRRRSRAGCGSRRARGAGRAPAGGARARPGRAVGMSSRWARGETSTSSTPATSVVERARPRTSWRTAVSGPIVSTPRRSVGMR